MAPPAAPRAADADVLCFRFGRPGLRQTISAPVPLYARPAGHSDQRPLSDRYLAAPVAVGVRVARSGEGPDPAARRTAFLCAVRRHGSGGADAADRGAEGQSEKEPSDT